MVKHARIFAGVGLGALIFLGQLPFLCAADAPTRKPYVAGSFYPTDKKSLELMIDGFLEKVPPFTVPPSSTLTVLIAPHAGYVYSGQTAAYAYKLLENQSFDAVILLGVYHKKYFDGASVWTAGDWETPLGAAAVDRDLALAIARDDPAFQESPDFHLEEHSLEAQVPFLQRTLKNFRMVPILTVNPTEEGSRRLADVIVRKCEGKKVLVIASTDMSHYHSKAFAEKMDHFTLSFIFKGDIEGLRTALFEGKAELCGNAGVLTALEIAKHLGATKIEMLDYRNSGDVTEEESSVVGYCAFAFYKNSGDQVGNVIARSPKDDEAISVEAGFTKIASQKTLAMTKVLDVREHDELLRIAKESVERYVKEKKVPDFQVTDPVLTEKKAVFVTIRKHGMLRGCIGTFSAEQPLALAVRDMAIEAATRDFRFSPVRPTELGSLKYEVSVLSEPQKTSTDRIELGKHGVIVKNGSNSGVFLPQVAEETGWTKEEFLGELCSQKAGLPGDCWKDPSTELYAFTAEVFGGD